MNPAVGRLLLGALAISFAPVLVRAMTVPATPAAMWRLLVGGAILTVIVTGSDRGAWRSSRRGLGLAMLAGVFFAADLWFWHRCIRILGPGVATLLGNLQVLPLALGGWWLWGERPAVWFWVALPVAGAGLGLVAGLGSEVQADGLGVLYGLLTAVTYAGYILGLRGAGAAASHPSPLRDVAVASVLSGMVLVPVVWVEGVRFLPQDGMEVGFLLLYAVVPQVIGWVLIAGALPRVSAVTAGMTLLLQPVLAMGWDMLFFARVFGGREVLGAALLLMAIALGQRRARRSDRPAVSDEG